jgi:hypothetical protein
MTDGLLVNIIQQEKKIQADTAREKKRAESWQQRELVALQTALADQQRAIETQFEQALSDREKQLLHEGEELETVTRAWCQRLENLDNTELNQTLQTFLAVLLSGGDHDHPHGES